jgi:methanogenic corrinoid protein MtbC1
MQNVVDTAKAAGLRDKIKIMIGGAPVTDSFCKQISADYFTPDAASAAEVAAKICMEIGA